MRGIFTRSLKFRSLSRDVNSIIHTRSAKGSNEFRNTSVTARKRFTPPKACSTRTRRRAFSRFRTFASSDNGRPFGFFSGRLNVPFGQSFGMPKNPQSICTSTSLGIGEKIPWSVAPVLSWICPENVSLNTRMRLSAVVMMTFFTRCPFFSPNNMGVERHARLACELGVRYHRQTPL